MKTIKDTVSQPPPGVQSPPTTLTGTHPGLGKLKAREGIYRCLLRRDLHKKNPEHADYKGVLSIANGRAWVMLWVHEDGTLGLRLEKIIEGPEKAAGKVVAE
jgi:hypothetical protein